MSYCLYLIATTRIPLTFNIIIQRFDINVVLDIIIWGLPLFEFISFIILSLSSLM